VNEESQFQMDTPRISEEVAEGMAHCHLSPSMQIEVNGYASPQVKGPGIHKGTSWGVDVV
jgi:hypothetical protein